MSDFKITGPGFYRTREGQKVEVVGRSSRGLWCGEIPGNYSRRWDDYGLAFGCGTIINNPGDIIAPWTEPKKGTVWVNVYAFSHTGEGCTHDTREQADKSACRDRIACVSVNWTEGEGLS